MPVLQNASALGPLLEITLSVRMPGEKFEDIFSPGPHAVGAAEQYPRCFAGNREFVGLDHTPD